MQARTFDTLTQSGGPDCPICEDEGDCSLFQAAGQYLAVTRPGFSDCQSEDPGLLVT